MRTQNTFWSLSSLHYLNGAQCLGALNDNFYRGLTVHLLLDLSPPEAKGTVLALAGALFLLPFLLLSSTGGRLADCYSKSRIIVAAKAAEIFVMALGAYALWTRSFSGALFVLSLMAAQSALFTPSKYGIVPEIVPRNTLPRANGWLALFTNLAIVLGTGLAAEFCRLTDRDFALGGCVCTLIALAGTLLSLGIEYTFPKSVDKGLHWRFWSDIWRNWKKAGKLGHLQSVLLSYFAGYYIAGYLQVNMIPYAIDVMGRADLDGSYLFSYTAVGIGLGAVLAGNINRRALKMYHVPIAFFSASLGLASLAAFHEKMIYVLLSLQVTGLCMGFFIVPAETYLQTITPDADRGEMLATASFLSFFGALAAAGTLYLFDTALQFTPAQGFGVYAGFALIAGALLWRQLGTPLKVR